MKNMEEWFAAQDFDQEAMPSGHRNRFLDKLKAADKNKMKSKNKNKADGELTAEQLDVSVGENKTKNKDKNKEAEDAERLIADESAETETTEQKSGRVISMTSWLKWSLVAGLAVLLSVGGYNVSNNLNQPEGLESVSPQMAQAQDFFTSTINLELDKLNRAQSPQNERIIADTKTGLNILEEEYTRIKEDFKINNDSKAVIAAMIQNFQNRIDLLETALAQIDQLKKLKETEHESTI
jgi:hypothetical protein